MVFCRIMNVTSWILALFSHILLFFDFITYDLVLGSIIWAIYFEWKYEVGVKGDKNC